MSSTSSDVSSPPHVVPAKFRGKYSFGLSDEGSGDDQGGIALPSSCLPSTPSDQGHQRAGAHALVAGEKATFCAHVGDPWFRSMKWNVQDPYVMARPLPSLTSRFLSYLSCGEDPIDSPHSDNNPFPEFTDSVYSQSKEYDLESMDIRVRESYFEVSEERGHWMSSPTVSSTHAQTFISSTARARSSTPDWQARTRRLSANSVTCSEVSSTSFLHDGRETWDGSCCSSPLPSSSPPTSPMSFALSLPGDHAGTEDCDSVDRALSVPSDGVHFSSEVARANVEEPCDRMSPDEFGRHESTVVDLPRYAEGAQLLSVPVRAGCSTHCVHPVSERCCYLSYGHDDNVSAVKICPDELCWKASSEIQHLRDRAASPKPIAYRCLDPGRSPAIVKIEGDNSRTVLLQAETSVRGASAQSKSDCDTAKDTSEWSGAPVVRSSNDMVPTLAVSETRSLERRTKRNARNSNSPLGRPKKKGKLSIRGGSGVGSQKQATREARAREKNRSAESSSSSSGVKELADDRSAWVATTEIVAPSSLQSTSEFSAEESTEITGIVVEALATSRATSMDTAALYLVLTRAHPELKTRRPKKEFLRLIGSVLEAGHARCGMFEMVQSSGDANDEGYGRWFYVPEKDEDKERALLIRALVPRQKRSETMKYKQYYWKPLDRISRWDPEDAL